MLVFSITKEKPPPHLFFIFSAFHIWALSIYGSETIKNIQINDLKITPITLILVTIFPLGFLDKLKENGGKAYKNVLI